MPAQPPTADHPAARNTTAPQDVDALAAELSPFPPPHDRPGALGAGPTDEKGSLNRLRADFPQFWIWRENTGSGVRYIARSQRAGLNPHTVVTDDPAELRAALGHPDRPR